MAAIHGNTGNFSAIVAAAEVFALVRSWSGGYSRTNFDVTTFSDSTFRTQIVGLANFQGLLEGFIDVSASQATNFTNWQSDAVAFILTASTGRTFTFTGQFKSYDIDVQTGQPMTIRGEWKATGAITVA